MHFDQSRFYFFHTTTLFCPIVREHKVFYAVKQQYYAANYQGHAASINIMSDSPTIVSCLNCMPGQSNIPSCNSSPQDKAEKLALCVCFSWVMWPLRQSHTVYTCLTPLTARIFSFFIASLKRIFQWIFHHCESDSHHHHYYHCSLICISDTHEGCLFTRNLCHSTKVASNQ